MITYKVMSCWLIWVWQISHTEPCMDVAHWITAWRENFCTLYNIIAMDHKRRKKWARRKLDRRKTHHTEHASKEDIPPPTQFTPTRWQEHATSEGVTLSQYRCQVSSSLVFHQDGTWTAFFMGHTISSKQFSLAQNITSSDILQDLILTRQFCAQETLKMGTKVTISIAIESKLYREHAYYTGDSLLGCSAFLVPF